MKQQNLYNGITEQLYELCKKVLDEEREIVLDEGRFKIVNRVRKGKVQRRKRVATKDGYTIRGGKMVRMKPSERRKRKISQKKGSRKRKAKAGRSLRKRKISLRKSERLS